MQKRAVDKFVQNGQTEIVISRAHVVAKKVNGETSS